MPDPGGLLAYGPLGVAALLLLCGVGFPLPEEVSLLSAGVLVEGGHASLWAALLAGYIGLLGGDLITFALGRGASTPSRVRDVIIRPEQIERLRSFYDRFGALSILIARPLPGMRVPIFFLAGASNLSLGRFVLINGVAALFSVGVWVSLGITFADDLTAVLYNFERFRSTSGIVGGILVAALLTWLVWSRRQRPAT